MHYNLTGPKGSINLGDHASDRSAINAAAAMMPLVLRDNWSGWVITGDDNRNLPLPDPAVDDLASLQTERDQLRASRDQIRTDRAELARERDQLRAELTEASRLTNAVGLERNDARNEAAKLRVELAEAQRLLKHWTNVCADVQSSRDELRRSQDLLIRHLGQPSRFRLYIQPRLTPDSDGDLDVILPSGAVVGYVSRRVLGGYLATFTDASWAVPFATQAEAVDWLTELAQYSAWADCQQGLAAAAEGE